MADQQQQQQQEDESMASPSQSQSPSAAKKSKRAPKAPEPGFTEIHQFLFSQMFRFDIYLIVLLLPVLMEEEEPQVEISEARYACHHSVVACTMLLRILASYIL
jgi:hypothetical protein